MKYTIEGFSQEYALTLKKEIVTIDKNGNKKTKTTRIDCTDLVILRWFVDFYPNMKKMNVDGVEYAWLSHKKLNEDLPILDISKRSCIDRMQKLVDFGILKYKLIKEGGTFSLYAFGENYENLISKKRNGYAIDQHRGMQSTNIGGMQSNDIGVCNQPTNKDISIKDSSITDYSTNNKKKVSKSESYDDLIESYTDDDDLRKSLKAFIQMRKLIKKPLTKYALKLILNKLDKMSTDSKTKTAIVNQSVEHSWQGVFPLKDSDRNTNNQSKQPEQKKYEMHYPEIFDFQTENGWDEEGYNKAVREYNEWLESSK